jgi:hypothetical protein
MVSKAPLLYVEGKQTKEDCYDESCSFPGKPIFLQDDDWQPEDHQREHRRGEGVGDEVGVAPCTKKQKVGHELKDGVEEVGDDVLAIEPCED